MSNTLKLQGRIIHDSGIEARGAKNFQVRTIVLDTGGKYPQQIPVEFNGEKSELPDHAGLKVGDTIDVSFNLRGREWEGRWFVSLAAWTLEVLSSYGNSSNSEPTALDEEPDDSLDEDIPF